MVRLGDTSTETNELLNRRRALLETQRVLRSILLDTSTVPVGEFKESHGERVRPRCDEQYDTRKSECEREKESCSDDYDVVMLQRSQNPSVKMLDQMLNQGKKSLNVIRTVNHALEKVSLQKQGKGVLDKAEKVKTSMSRPRQRDQEKKMEPPKEEDKDAELDRIETDDSDLDETVTNDEKSSDSYDFHEEEGSLETDVSEELPKDQSDDDEDATVQDVDVDTELMPLSILDSESSGDVNLVENADVSSAELVPLSFDESDSGNLHEFNLDFDGDVAVVDESM